MQQSPGVTLAVVIIAKLLRCNILLRAAFQQ